MATPPNVGDVSIYAGDTVVFPAYRFRGSGGEPLDLSDWTWRAQWRKDRKSQTAVTLVVDDSQSGEGLIQISVPSSTSSNLGSGVWDLEGTNGSTVKTWAQGTTTFTTDVTR